MFSAPIVERIVLSLLNDSGALSHIEWRFLGGTVLEPLACSICQFIYLCINVSLSYWLQTSSGVRKLDVSRDVPDFFHNHRVEITCFRAESQPWMLIMSLRRGS